MCRDINCDCNHREYNRYICYLFREYKKEKATITGVLCGFLTAGKTALFPDTEARENAAQQIIRSELPGDLA